jgi:repressor LexA
MVDVGASGAGGERGNLSEKQQRILEFLRDFIADKDYPPSIRDIQQGCGISSTSVVDYNLKRLEERGYIRRDREVSRAIELLDGSGSRRRPLTVPLVGTIAAGSPIPMPPETLPAGYEEVAVTEAQTRGRPNAFALRVQGTSMIDALIDDGDIVILEPTQSCDDGEMVAVWLRDENETTLKKFFHEGDRIRLQPMNSTMEPIYTKADNVEVQGRVLSSFRLA